MIYSNVVGIFVTRMWTSSIIAVARQQFRFLDGSAEVKEAVLLATFEYILSRGIICTPARNEVAEAAECAAGNGKNFREIVKNTSILIWGLGRLLAVPAPASAEVDHATCTSYDEIATINPTWKKWCLLWWCQLMKTPRPF